MRTGRAGAGDGLAVTGTDAATSPGGGEPSAVKSDCCSASVLGLMGCVGLGRIIMTVLSEVQAKGRAHLA